MMQPVQPLFWRHGVPLLHQPGALLWRQFLETLIGGVQLVALFRRHLVEQALVLARLLAFGRRHLLPVRDALADLLALVGRQAYPLPALFQQTLLALRWHPVPFLA